jgi:AcrR family transcriptional regulator
VFENEMRADHRSDRRSGATHWLATAVLMQETAFESGSTQRYARKREVLLAAASQLFNERGVRGVTLADVAQRVGLARNSITYYYRRKEDFAAACFLRTIEVFSAIVGQAQRQATAGERIRELIRLHLELHDSIASGRHPAVMAFRDIRALTAPMVDEVFDAYTTMFRRVRALLQAPETQGLRGDELNARAHLLVSLLNRLPQMVKPHDAAESERVLRRLCDIVLQGIHASNSCWQERGPEQQWSLAARGDTPGENFLRAATGLINEQGYRGASVVRISQRLQLTKGAFYYYHANKDDLVGQCFERSFGILRTGIALAEQAPGDGWQRTCSMVRGLVQFQLSAAGPLLRSTASSALPDPERRAQVTEAYGRLRDKVSGLVVSGIVDGTIRGTDAFLSGYCLLNGIDAAAELARWVRGVSEVNVAALYARPMLLGLLCPPQQDLAR